MKKLLCLMLSAVMLVTAVSGIDFTAFAETTHTHSYDKGVITKEPTCEAGIKVYTCQTCGATKKVSLAAKYQHNFKNVTTKATLKKNGAKAMQCTTCNKVKPNTEVTTIYSPKTFTMATKAVYNGKVKTPAVTVKDSKGKTLVKNTDYTVTYASGRKNVGKYAVKITFKGNYSGTKTLYFMINPASTCISSLSSNAPKSFTVKWKKKTAQVTGYQIQYSTSSSFSSYKLIMMKKNSYYAKKVTGLAAKKKYYVRVRTYKTVGGKNYYSAWSSVKSVTTK